MRWCPETEFSLCCPVKGIMKSVASASNWSDPRPVTSTRRDLSKAQPSPLLTKYVISNSIYHLFVKIIQTIPRPTNSNKSKLMSSILVNVTAGLWRSPSFGRSEVPKFQGLLHGTPSASWVERRNDASIFPPHRRRGHQSAFFLRPLLGRRARTLQVTCRHKRRERKITLAEGGKRPAPITRAILVERE